MRDIIYPSCRIFSLWVLLCRHFQTHKSRLKQNYILFHSLLILKIPFSKEIFNLNNKFFIVQRNLIWQNLANLLSFCCFLRFWRKTVKKIAETTVTLLLSKILKKRMSKVKYNQGPKNSKSILDLLFDPFL
eukprot:UN01589